MTEIARDLVNVGPVVQLSSGQQAHQTDLSPSSRNMGTGAVITDHPGFEVVNGAGTPANPIRQEAVGKAVVTDK